MSKVLITEQEPSLALLRKLLTTGTDLARSFLRLQVHRLNGVLGLYTKVSDSEQPSTAQQFLGEMLMFSLSFVSVKTILRNSQTKALCGAMLTNSRKQVTTPPSRQQLLTHSASYHYLGPGSESKCSGAQTH